jgi:hypothetical protein
VQVLCSSPQLGRNDRAEPDEDLSVSCVNPVRAPEGRESVRRTPADFGPTAEHRSHQRGAEAVSSVYTASLYGGVAARSRAVSHDQAGAHCEK